jgi:hypothetical protein
MELAKHFPRHFQALALAVLAAALVLPASHAQAQDDAWRTWAPEREISGARLHIDNDLFAGRELDRDYTGGEPTARYTIARPKPVSYTHQKLPTNPYL